MMTTVAVTAVTAVTAMTAVAMTAAVAMTTRHATLGFLSPKDFAERAFLADSGI